MAVTAASATVVNYGKFLIFLFFFFVGVCMYVCVCVDSVVDG